MAVQTTYTINPPDGFPGMIAAPGAPTWMDAGVLHVPGAATRNPRPGDSLYYDTTENAWAIPTDAAQQLLVTGILGYRQDQVANADAIVEFTDEDEIQVILMGVVWVTAGGAVESQSQVVWQTDDFKYDTNARETAVADMYVSPIVAQNRTAAVDTNIIPVSIGYGRVI